jgi:hypothetical protein
MWPMQPANSPSDYVTTAGNGTPITPSEKTGADLRCAQTTMSQRSHSLSRLSIAETLSLFWSLGQTVLSRWTCMLALQGIQRFKVWEALMVEQTCSPTQKYKLSKERGKSDLLKSRSLRPSPSQDLALQPL